MMDELPTTKGPMLDLAQYLTGQVECPTGTWENPDTPIYVRGFGDGVAAARIEIIEWLVAQNPLPGGTADELLWNLRNPSARVGHKADSRHGAAVPECHQRSGEASGGRGVA